jgi:L-alanine-DL-glutamate epimerase-like enolase superfamily enzyme
LKADNWEGHKAFKRSVLPIIADESCIIEEDVSTWLFHGVNIKLAKCGD